MPRQKTAVTKETRAPRIALYLPTDPQALYTHCSASWAAIKADTVHFTSPLPPPAQIDADLQALGAALQTAESGSPAATAAVRVAADKVRQDFELLAKYVQSVVRAGPIDSALGLIANVLMFESKVGKRAPKPPLAVKAGPNTGTVLLIALAVASAQIYYWEWSLDQVTWVGAPQTAKARTLVLGLTAGKLYYFRFRAFKRDGTTTDNSQVVSFICH